MKRRTNMKRQRQIVTVPEHECTLRIIRKDWLGAVLPLTRRLRRGGLHMYICRTNCRTSNGPITHRPVGLEPEGGGSRRASGANTRPYPSKSVALPAGRTPKPRFRTSRFGRFRSPGPSTASTLRRVVDRRLALVPGQTPRPWFLAEGLLTAQPKRKSMPGGVLPQFFYRSSTVLHMHRLASQVRFN